MSLMVCRFFSPFFFQHYLCDPGIPLPKMEVTFSMQRLSRIEAECKHYMSEIQRMHRQLQEQRENEVNSRNSHSFFFLAPGFGSKARQGRTDWLKIQKNVKRHKEHVFLFTYGLGVSLFHY